MRYFSDVTNKFYDTQGECVAAEHEAALKAEKEKAEKEKIANERKTRAKEVEDARKAMVAARTKYAELLEAFTKDYHVFHQTLTGEDAKKAIPTLFNFLDDLIL